MLKVVGSFLINWGFVKKEQQKKKHQEKNKTKQHKQVRGSSVSASYAFNELVPGHCWEQISALSACWGNFSTCILGVPDTWQVSNTSCATSLTQPGGQTPYLDPQWQEQRESPGMHKAGPHQVWCALMSHLCRGAPTEAEAHEPSTFFIFSVNLSTLSQCKVAAVESLHWTASGPFQQAQTAT